MIGLKFLGMESFDAVEYIARYSNESGFHLYYKETKRKSRWESWSFQHLVQCSYLKFRIIR